MSFAAQKKEFVEKIIGNISVKSKELNQKFITMERMGVFSKCSEADKKAFSTIVKELVESSEGLERNIK